MSTALRAFPEILAEMDRIISEAPQEDMPAIIAALAARVGVAAARASGRGIVSSDSSTRRAEDGLLTREEAALRLGVAKSWLARRRGLVPFEVPLGPRTPRYSAAGIDKYIQTRNRRGNKPS